MRRDVPSLLKRFTGRQAKGQWTAWPATQACVAHRATGTINTRPPIQGDR